MSLNLNVMNISIPVPDTPGNRPVRLPASGGDPHAGWCGEGKLKFPLYQISYIATNRGSCLSYLAFNRIIRLAFLELRRMLRPDSVKMNRSALHLAAMISPLAKYKFTVL